MDSIEVYVLCCTLPLLAFAALMVQLYRNSYNKRTVIDQLQFHDDDFLYTLHGLITIDTQTQQKVQRSQACNEGPGEREDGGQCKAKSVTECRGRQAKMGRNEDSGELAGCTAGISRINLINRKILKKKQQAVNEKQQERRKRLFPTHRIAHNSRGASILITKNLLLPFLLQLSRDGVTLSIDNNHFCEIKRQRGGEG